MIKIENVETYGIWAAIRGMRNPLESWDKSDSERNADVVGTGDLALMRKLCLAGPDHRKFMRMINVSMDITAPLYWWKEMETYKVGTVSNSCSTMHTIHKRMFAIDDFSHEHLFDENGKCGFRSSLWLTIADLNYAREAYLETGDKMYWWQMIQLLPQSYNQKRTVQFNYENAWNIYHARREHKLDEWREFCEVIHQELPLFSDIIDATGEM